MEAVLQADLAAVFPALRIDLLPYGIGYALKENPQIYLQGPVWQHLQGKTGPKGLFTRGSAVHFLVEYRSMPPAQALDTVCSIIAPELLNLGKPQRMLPRERLQQEKRTGCLQQLITSSEEEESSPRLPEEVPKQEERAAACLKSRGLAMEIVRDVLASRAAYPARGCVIFPGCTDEKEMRWYFVLSMRSDTDAGHIGSHAAAFSEWPWIWGNRKAACVHVYTSPLQALASLTLALRHTPLNVLQQDTHLALTAPCEAVGVYAHLLRSPCAKDIILHLHRDEESMAAGRLMERQLPQELFSICWEQPPDSFRTWLDVLREEEG